MEFSTWKLTSSSWYWHFTCSSDDEDCGTEVSFTVSGPGSSANTSVAKVVICPFKLLKLWFKFSHDIFETKINLAYHSGDKTTWKSGVIRCKQWENCIIFANDRTMTSWQNKKPFFFFWHLLDSFVSTFRLQFNSFFSFSGPLRLYVKVCQC